MTTARRKTVNYNDTHWFHCISKIARGLTILDRYEKQLKKRIESETRRLSKIFAIGVGGHAILGNHFHFLLRVDLEKAQAWSAHEVVSRWAQLCPPKNKKRETLKGHELDFWIDEKAKDLAFVEERRSRLTDMGWFHRFLKQPLSVFVNKLDACTGTLFQGRYKSIAVLGFQALLNVAIYIDLNPVAAGIVDLPEKAEFTSFRLRFENAVRSNLFPEMADRFNRCLVDGIGCFKAESSLWLISIENRSEDGSCDGMFDGLSLIQYMILVDEAGRLPREGKASISSEATEILRRMGIEHSKWRKQQLKLGLVPMRGHYYATDREVLRRVAEREGKRCVVNLNGSPC